MTRKDYIIVATAIKRAYMDDDARISVMAELAVEFLKDNPRFNYDTFKEACTPDERKR